MTTGVLPKRLAVVAVVALVVASCGDSDSDDEGGATTTEPPTTTTAPAATTTEAPDPEPTTTTTTTPATGGPVTYVERDCWPDIAAASATCGTAEVPADWDDRDGDTMQIAVAVLAATDGANRVDDPVVVMSGGPGGSAVLEAESVLRVWGDLNQTRDVVLIDQRGTGFSEPFLGCDAEEPAGLLACRDAFVADGVDVTQFTSAAIAADFAAIPAAMGYEEWNLWGGSYGTRVGLTIIRDDATGVRSIVLDSVFPLEVNGFTDGNVAIRDALAALFARCADASACNGAFPDLPADLNTLLDRLGPEGAVPALANIVLAAADPDIAAIIGQGAASDDAAESAAIRLEVAANAVQQRQAASASSDNERSSATAMSLSVLCAEEFPQGTEAPPVDLGYGDAVDAATAALGPSGSPIPLGNVDELCTAWQPAAVDPVEFEQVTDFDLPALVVGGTSDFQTPASWSRTTAEQATRGTYLEVFGEGHVPTFSNTCLIEAMGRFLDDPAAPLQADCDPGTEYVTETSLELAGDTGDIGDDGGGDGFVDPIVACLAENGVDLGVDATDPQAVGDALNGLDLDDEDVVDALFACS